MALARAVVRVVRARWGRTGWPRVGVDAIVLVPLQRPRERIERHHAFIDELKTMPIAINTYDAN